MENGAPPPPASKMFATSFFGSDDKGQDVLIQRMRAGKHTSEEVLAVLQQRATIEEDYAKKLRKLSNLVMGREESGTLKDSLEVIRKELETTAKQRLQLCESMRQELERKLAELIVGQATIRKQHQTICEKNLKNKVAQTAAVMKLREKYDARCLDLQQLMSSRTGLPPKEIEKVRLKIDATTAAAKKADLEYQQGVVKLKEYHAKWEQDWRTACEQFQRLEQDRIEFMRASLWQYANMLSTVCVAEDDGSERIRVSLERLDPTADIQNFVDTSATGSNVPPPFPYINFYTRTSVPSDPTFGGSPALLSQPSVPSITSQISGLEIGKPVKSSSTDSLSHSAATPATTTSRIDYKLGFGEEKKPSAQDVGPASGYVLPRKASVRRNASVKSAGVAASETDVTSEDLEGDEDMYFDYDPYDLSVAKPVICWVRVNYEYVPQAREELHIKKGMTVPVIQQQEDGWWEGEFEEADGRRRRGLFPSNFASVIPTPTI